MSRLMAWEVFPLSRLQQSPQEIKGDDHCRPVVVYVVLVPEPAKNLGKNVARVE